MSLEIKQYGVYTLKETAIERSGGKMISTNSRVVVLELYPDRGMAKICRYGYYWDSLEVALSMLEK